jgi:predicted transposase YbfD/YdcC
MEIIIIAICGVICGANDWVAIETFGKSKEAWLRTFLRLPNGIPSHDTFGRVFAQIDPIAFQNSFVSWIKGVSQVIKGEVVAIDGKSLRRSHDRGIGKEAIHMVSAWASQSQLVLGQVKVDDKSNEITAIPALLRLLAIKGCIITLDAMGTQTDIAAQAVDQGADYALALKDNHKKLHQEVVSLFSDALADPNTLIPYQMHQTVDKGHGRLEIRRCYVIDDPHYIAYLDPDGRWAGLKSVVRIEAERHLPDKQTTEVRHYLSSLPGDPKLLNQVIRTHWTIENQLHWILDVAFREDDARIRQGHASENMALLRHIALNLLKQEQSAKTGIHNKRLRAGWDQDYLLKILMGLT